MKAHHNFVEMAMISCELNVSGSHPANRLYGRAVMRGLPQRRLQFAGTFIRKRRLKRGPIREIAVKGIRREIERRCDVSKGEIPYTSAG
jgi:hypothetical protein